MKKSKVVFIVTTIIVSFFLSFLFEYLIINKSVLGKKSINNLKVIETKNVEHRDNKYITTSKNAYFIIDTKNSYINNLEFNYKSKKGFDWKVSYVKNNEEMTYYFSSSPYLKTAIKKINSTVDQVKVEINSKNVEISNFSIDNNVYIYWERVLVITLILSLLIVLYKYRNYFTKNIEKTFFICGFIIGFSFIILTPKLVYNSYDDQIHFKNTIRLFQKEKYTLSYAEQIVIEGIDVRDNNNYYTTEIEKKELYSYLNKIHRKTKYRTVENEKITNIYSKIIYIPFWIGYKISNCLNFNFITSMIISKLFNLFTYILLITFAIKNAKYGKKIIFSVGMFPTSLFLASQFSYDPTIIASIIFATALFVNIITDDKLNKKALLGFIILVVWACLPKAIYCPLLLLLLFINNDRFDNKKQALIFKILVIVLTALISVTFIIPATTGALSGDSRGGDTSVSGQIKFILSNPISYAKNLIKYTYFHFFENFLGSGNMINFAYTVNNDLLIPLYGVYLVFICFVLFTSKSPNIKFNKLFRLLFMIELIGIWILICTALYLSFTPVGSNSINGVQTRYFVPLLPMILYLLIPKKNLKEDEITYVYYFVQIILALMVLGIISLKVIG